MAEADGTDVYGEYSEFYDVYVGDFLNDLPFYMEFASPVKTRVLEIGAGSGRLTLPMAPPVTMATRSESLFIAAPPRYAPLGLGAIVCHNCSIIATD